MKYNHNHHIITRLFQIFICLLLGMSSTVAQQFKVTQYTVNSGLPTNSIRSVVQDDIGFIWIATDAGLIRYDGKKFERFKKGLRSEYIRHIFPMSDGNMLISSDFGVSKVISRRDTVIIETLVKGGLVATDSTVLYPNRVFEDSQGRVWISQPNGVVSCYSRNKLKHYNLGKRNATGASDSHFSFAEDDRGVVWVASEPGLIFYYDPDIDRIREVVTGRRKAAIHDLKYMGDGKFWIAGAGLQEVVFNEKQKVTFFRNFDYIPLDLTKIIEMPNGDIYFGTPIMGLLKGVETEFGEMGMDPMISYDLDLGEEFPFTVIRSAYVTNSGDLWIASENGLGLLQNSMFSKVSSAFPSLSATSIAETASGDIYLTMGQVFRIFKEGNSTEYESITTGEGVVSSVAASGERVWIGTATGEVFYYQDYQLSEKVHLTDRGSSISYMFCDSQGNVWACQKPAYTPIVGIVKITEMGVNDFDSVFYDDTKGVNTRILVGKESKNGILYFGGIGKDTYLYRYHERSDAFLNLSVPFPLQGDETFEVKDLAVDENEEIWMATTHGLMKYASEKVHKVDLGADYSGIEIRGITTTDDGTLWIATDTDGILRYKNGEVMRFEVSSGLPTKIMNYRSILTSSNQKLWVGTAEGVAISQEANPRPKPTPTPTFLSVKVNGEEWEDKKQKANFPFESNFWAEYISLAYPGSGITYQTRIRRVEPDETINKSEAWSEGGNGQDIDDLTSGYLDGFFKYRKIGKETHFLMEQLPEGNYIFEVRARQKGGYAWSEPLMLEFSVDKVWYMTWWAYTILGVIILAVVWVLVRLNTWRLLRDKYKLENVIQSRTAELLEKNKLLEEQTKEILAQSESLKEASKEIAEQKDTIEKSYEDIKLLTQIGKSIIMANDMDAAEQTIANYLDNIIEYSSFAIGIPNEVKGGIEFNIFKRNDGTHFYQDFVPFGTPKNLLIWSWNNKKELIIHNLENDCEQYVKDVKFKRENMNYSQIYLPLEVSGDYIGIIALQDTKPNQYDDNDMLIVKTLGTYVSAMIHRLFYDKTADIKK